MKKSLMILLLLLPFLFLAEEGSPEKTASEQPMFNEKIEVVGRINARQTVQSVTTLPAHDWQRFKIVLVKEAFTLVPGVIHLNTGHPGQLGYLYVRGASPNQTVVAINGIPLFDAVSTLGIDPGGLSTILFSKMEFVRGPLSNYLGSNAMGGVLNFCTSRDNQIVFELGLASNQTVNGGVNISRRLANFFLAGGIDGRSYSAGFANDRFKGLLSKFEAGLEKENFSAGLQFVGNFSSSGIPFNMGQPTLNRHYQRNFILLNFPLKVGFGINHTLNVSFNWQQHDYQLEDKDSFWSPFYQTRSDQFRGKVDYQFSYGSFNGLLSFDYSRQTAKSGEEKNNFSFFEKGYAFASALNLNWSKERFVIGAGVRLDKYRQLSAVLSPQAGVRWELTPESVVKFSFSSSFRAPQLPELYNPLWGNPELKPERNFGLESGLTFFGKKFDLTICYFYSRYNNLIGYNPQKWKFDNINRATVAGVEFSAGYQLFTGLKVITIINYLYTHDWQYQRELLRRPKWAGHLRLNYNWKKISSDLNFSYVGKRLDYNEIIWSVDRSPAYNYTNLTVGYKLTNNLELSLKLSNLFDQEYQEVMGYPAPGRRWSLNLRYRN